ncbi:MAG: LTA synthase family protein [Planctomycetes bacterium]|nr:LTA synthase family protein [Planctomycetota bacterium]
MSDLKGTFKNCQVNSTGLFKEIRVMKSDPAIEILKDFHQKHNGGFLPESETMAAFGFRKVKEVRIDQDYYGRKGRPPYNEDTWRKDTAVLKEFFDFLDEQTKDLSVSNVGPQGDGNYYWKNINTGEVSVEEGHFSTKDHNM